MKHRKFFRALPASFIVCMTIFSILAHDKPYFHVVFVSAIGVALLFFLAYTFFTRMDIDYPGGVTRGGSKAWKQKLSFFWGFPALMTAWAAGDKFGARWGWLVVALFAVAPVVFIWRFKPRKRIAADPVDVLAQVETLIAYGRDAQAIHLLQDALTVWPADQRLTQKLAQMKQGESPGSQEL